MIQSLTAALAAGLLVLAAAPVVQAQNASPDALADPAVYKTTEVIAFIGVKPGDKVAEIFAARFARAFSKAVGPGGRLYAVEPTEMVKAHPDILTHMQALSALPDYRNVSVINEPLSVLGLPPGLDAVFIRQDYHDLHDKFLGSPDVGAFNRGVFASLKPGGVYVVLDHVAAAGSGLRDTDTLHRIDPETVKAEVTAAGFVFDGESKVLANPADPHDKFVFDPSIHGKTDQFLYRFRKPG